MKTNPYKNLTFLTLYLRYHKRTLRKHESTIMRAYTQDEALLRAWKKKLIAVDSKRTSLKRELLALLSDERASTLSRKLHFTDKQRQLLNGEHQQGRKWKPTYDWLFSILFFLTRHDRFSRKAGSRLRNALEQTPEPETFDLLSMQDLERPISGNLLNDEAYENALFDAPATALEDVKIRLSQQRVPADQARLLERVHALKYRLDSTAWQQILKQLYQSHPAQTALYFYETYKRERYITPANNDFIELNALTHVLMQHFVRNTDNIYQRNYKMTYLLSLLMLANTPALQTAISEGQDPFQQLLLDWQDSGQADFKAYDQLSERFEQQVLAKLPADIKASRSGHQAIVKGLDNWILTPMQLLGDCLQYCAPVKHPLLTHMGRQALEQLYSDAFHKPKDSTWHPGHSGHEAISLISQHFAIPSSAPRLSKRWDESLNATGYIPIIATELRLAEKCALTLIKEILLMGDFLTGAYNVRTQFVDGDNLRAEDLNWIITRVERLNASYAAPLRRILFDIKIYHLQTPMSVNPSPEQGQIHRICNNLDLANRAAREGNSQDENRCIAQVMSDIADYLVRDRSNSKELGILHNEVFPQLRRRYLSDDLLKAWETSVSEQQATLLCWSVADVDTVETVKNPLLEAARQLQLAMDQQKTVYKRDFCAESQASKQAVACFYQHMKNHPAENRYQAKAVLNDLQAYVTPACYRQWSKELSRVSSSPSSSSASFYHAGPASLLGRETLEARFSVPGKIVARISEA